MKEITVFTQLMHTFVYVSIGLPWQNCGFYKIDIHFIYRHLNYWFKNIIKRKCNVRIHFVEFLIFRTKIWKLNYIGLINTWSMINLKLISEKDLQWRLGLYHRRHSSTWIFFMKQNVIEIDGKHMFDNNLIVFMIFTDMLYPMWIV